MNEDRQIQTESHGMEHYEDEIDLVDLVGVLWRRRWLMLGIIVVIVGLAIAYCFVATPKYEIISQISPGITGFDEKGNPVRDFSTNDIQAWFEKESYLETLASLLGDDKSFPKLKAGTTRQASLVTISFYWPDANQGKQLLKSLLNVLGSSDSTFSRRLETELRLIKKNITSAQQIIMRIKGQIDVINNNTQKLMQLRQEMAAGGSDKFDLLMCSNIIQQNITYMINLEQMISDQEKELNSYLVEEVQKSESLKNIQIKIKDLEVKRDEELPIKEAGLKKELSTLKTRLSAILPVEVVQPPFSSIKPVKPAKRKIVAIAIALSCFMAVLAAFLIEFWVKNRERVTASSPAKKELLE